MVELMTFRVSPDCHAEGAPLRRASEDLDHEGAKHEGCGARGMVPVCHAEGANLLLAPEASEVLAFQILRFAQDDIGLSDVERPGWDSQAEHGDQQRMTIGRLT